MNTKASLERLLRDGLLWQGAPELLTTHSSIRGGSSVSRAATSFGIPEIDTLLPFGGFPAGTIHEWGAVTNGRGDKGYPPCSILSFLAGNTLSKKNLSTGEPKNFILWIGKSTWPTPHLLTSIAPVSSGDILSHCIFIDPPDERLHLWSIEAALRSPAVSALITQCKNLRPTLLRRFSLAAEKSGVVAFFIRPERSLTTPSSSYSRWGITSAPSPTLFPRFELRLLRCKGGPSEVVHWIIELNNGVDHEKISLHIPPGVELFQEREKETHPRRRAL